MKSFKQFTEESFLKDPAEWIDKNVTDKNIAKIVKGGWKKLTGIGKKKTKPKSEPKSQPKPKKKKHTGVSSKDYLDALKSQLG